MSRIFPDVQAPVARSASDVAAELIRGAIVDGRLEPGQRLKEEALAREIGISRTPVREALLLLQTEGLVLSEPNRGATVRVYAREEIEDMYELRAILEGHAAHRAAARISGDDVRRLDESNRRFSALRAADDLADLIAENLVFHTIIVEAAASDRLAQMIRTVIELPLVYKAYYWYSDEQKRVSEHYHHQLARALGTHDAGRAELIMKEHVFEARDFLVERLRESE